MKTVSLPVSAILTDDRLRDPDPEGVVKLAESIQAHGLQTPITVHLYREVNPKDRTQWLPIRFDGLVRYKLIAGGHRLAAIKALGLTHITCFVKEVATPLEAIILEVLENLHRVELNPLDKCVFLGKQKEVYEELFPETKKGAKNQHTVNSLNETVSFSKDIAEKIGKTSRTVENYIRVYNGLSKASIDRIKNTWISEKQGELLHLSACDDETQAQYLDLMLRDKDPIQSVSKCKAHLAGRVERKLTPAEHRLEKLKSAWQNAQKSEQDAFLQHLAEQGVVLPELSKEAA